MGFKKQSVLFTTIVLAVIVSDALVIFFIWNALGNISNYLLNQIWVLPQRYEFRFSAVQKYFFPFFSFAIISDNAALFLPLKSQERQSNYFLLQHTGKNRNNSINPSWGSINTRKLFLDFWILRDSHCRCFPTVLFYFSWILFLLQKPSIV